MVCIYLDGGGLESWDLADEACPRCGSRSLFLRSYGGHFWSPEQEFQCGSCEHAFLRPGGEVRDVGPPERRKALKERSAG